MKLPNFVIAGERRCGSTAFAKWLGAHPEIFMHPMIGTDFFIDSAVVATREWFDGEVDESVWQEEHSIEEYSSYFLQGKGYKAVGEKCADYLYWKPSHKRLAQCLPADTKFLFTFRNPVNRAWSHYWNEIGKKRETLSFEEAIEAEADRCRRSAYARDHLSYVGRGRYADSLEAFFEYISPERTHIVTLESLIASPREVLAEVYRFLDVDPRLHLPAEWKTVNPNWTTVPAKWAGYPGLGMVDRFGVKVTGKVAHWLGTSSDAKKRIRSQLESFFRTRQKRILIDPMTRDSLTEYFDKPILRLEELTGRKFDEWRT